MLLLLPCFLCVNCGLKSVSGGGYLEGIIFKEFSEQQTTENFLLPGQKHLFYYRSNANKCGKNCVINSLFSYLHVSEMLFLVTGGMTTIKRLKIPPQKG